MGESILQHAESEITGPVALCDNKGLLNPEAIGFARRPIIQSNLTGHFMRKKKWNYWCVYGEDTAVSPRRLVILIMQLSAYVYILDYETQRFYEKQITIPIGRNVKMPEEVLESVKFTNESLSIQMIHIQGETHLSVTFRILIMKCFMRIFTLSIHQNDDSLNVVIPKSRSVFQFTAKHHTLPTYGFVKIGR